MLESSVPNLVEPVTKSWDEVITCTNKVWAVIVPLTKKSSALDAVAANEAETVLKDCEAKLTLPPTEAIALPVLGVLK